ncbi:glycoside hydrolase family 6 protein [Nocardioides sp. CER19]|uniref:glycoside hydrolase family 6 protein n=1 Tax=Nocardioides sp. CER19 TaxID=3038538 RepID=UPI00244AC3B7|nr:glycoside hydrolase family 6 protein [Nocardioides sp. CER19]MDH2416558.1 glycoside hydrolase family 6 protein [Nocardioides sp. CER19]
MTVRSATRRLIVAAVAGLLAVTLAPAVPAHAASANPLVGGWGLYTGQWDRTYPTYRQAKGRKKRLFAKVALQPHAAWFTSPDIPKLVNNLGEYIRNTQHGNPDALVQFALFRQWPHGEKRRNVPLTPQEQAAYRDWIDTAARVIGRSRTMIILEPDLALDSPGRSRPRTADPAVRLSLVRYAAQRLSSLPRTTVYLEAGSPDWLRAPAATRLLVSAGVRYTRGFALGGTHHTSVHADLRYAARIVARLGRAGYPAKHAVLDTADNGHPFTYQQYRRRHSHQSFLTPVSCKRKAQRLCVTLGAPPTTNPAAYRRKLGLNRVEIARLHGFVDAFVWVGRPWRGDNGRNFSPRRLLQEASTTPFQ